MNFDLCRSVQGDEIYDILKDFTILQYYIYNTIYQLIPAINFLKANPIRVPAAGGIGVDEGESQKRCVVQSKDPLYMK